MNSSHTEMLRCDECGRFVSYRDLETRAAIHRLMTPDSEFTREEFETLCPTHKSDEPGVAK